MPPDDLPRSPTGRVPRWVVEEAAGAPPAGQPWAWQEPAPPPRRSLLSRLAVVLALAVLAWWGVTTALPGVLREADAPFLDGIVAGRVPDPTPEVAALAGEMFLTERGRDLLYSSRPELLDLAQFAGRCDRAGSGASGAGAAVGCYHRETGGLEVGGRIVVYVPADPRARGFVVETAAHELLHAAWNELTPDEQAAATTALAAEVAALDPTDDLHDQLAASVGEDPANRPTEMFAYIGTQVWGVDGLDPRLEALYGRYVADRAALVAVHTTFSAQLDAMAAEVTAAQQALAQRQYDHSLATAQLDADTRTLAQYRATIEAEEARLAALPASQRSRALLSWTWRDGTPLPEAPAEELLADARALLARDEAELATRGAALEPVPAELAAEQARVDALRADLEALYAQLDPA